MNQNNFFQTINLKQKNFDGYQEVTVQLSENEILALE